MIAERVARLLPPPLRRTLRAAVDAPSRWAYRRALRRSGFRLAAGAPALSYGSALPREPGALVHGGRVKLTHLDRAFPENPGSFNVLYLVSSAIPPHALDLVEFARERGARFVWNQNGVGFPGWAGAETETFNAPMRALLERADFVVYQSAFCRRSADHFLAPASAGSAILFNPVDLAAFHPAAPAPDRNVWRLLAAGTHQEPGRVTRCIDALAELRRRGRNAELTIAGQFRFPHADAVIAAAVGRSGAAQAVRLRPAYPQAEAAELMRQNHALLHLKYADPCPTVAIEAMACGVPVLASRSGGMPELLGTDGGELADVPQGWDELHYPDATAIADAVERLMADWPARSAAARARAEHLFDHRHWVERHREIFGKLIRPFP